MPTSAPPAIPAAVEMPAAVRRHYRHFAWVVHEQRIVALLLAFTLAADALVWAAAAGLNHKPPVVVRAPPTLKEKAAAYGAAPEVSYDQLAFFLNGCLPLLYHVGEEGHPLLPLLQGVVAPEVYADAERRLDRAQPGVRANGATQSLTLTGLGRVTADAASGRAAVEADGYLTVTLRRSSARFYPWKAGVLLEANAPSRLNPYPFYLLRLDPSGGQLAASSP